MIIDLSSFLERINDFLPIEGEISVDKLDLKGRDISISPIKFQGQIFRLDGEEIIQLKISYNYGEDCNRCLNDSTYDVKADFYGKLSEDEKNSEEEDDEILVYKDYSLDLTNCVLNQVILSLPMKSLCSPDCKGLCPTCGTNLNDAKCNCANENIDPRLEVLKKFLPKD